MHHYPFHPADFNNATRHLSRIERSVYRDLLDLYYDTEKPLPNDIPTICRRIIATTEEERTAVQQVLNEFFDLVEQEWKNERCDGVILHYQTVQRLNSDKGKRSGEARRSKQNQATRTTVKPQLNQTRTESNQPEPEPEPVIDSTLRAGTPTLEQVQLWADSVMAPKECAEAFYGDHEGRGWSDRTGQMITNPRAAFNGFATRWKANDAQKKAQQRNSGFTGKPRNQAYNAAEATKGLTGVEIGTF